MNELTDPKPNTGNTAAGNTVMKRLQEWFYAKETPYSLALIRILFPLAMLVAVVPRWFHVRELYSTDGAPTPFWTGYGYPDLLPIFSPEIAMGLYTAMVFLLIAACIGWKTRVSLSLLMFLIPYFGMLDTLSTLTKYTIFVSHLSLLLALSECGAVWSVDAWIAKRRSPGIATPKVEIWPQRLIQLLVGVVYFGAAATKVQTEGFFSGDQMLFWTMTNMNYPNPLGDWMSLYPSFLVFSGYLSICWEVLFIFLIWKDPSRKIMLALGILFHVMTYFLLGLIVFPLLFLAIYCCFLYESEAKRLGEFVASLIPKHRESEHARTTITRIATWPVFGALLLVTSVVSIAAERQQDVYERNGPNGPIVLQPIPPELAHKLLRNDQKIKVEDQLFSIKFGTTTVGGHIANPRRTFTAGETVTMQAQLIRPHSDLWLEYTLRDPENRVVAREGVMAPREEMRKTLRIPLSDQLVAGEYWLAIEVNGTPSMKRRMIIRNESP